MWWLPPPLLSYNAAGKFGEMFYRAPGRGGVRLDSGRSPHSHTGGCRKFLILVQAVHPLWHPTSGNRWRLNSQEGQISNSYGQTQLLATAQDYKEESLYRVFLPFITHIFFIHFFSFKENAKLFIQISLKRPILYRKWKAWWIVF